MSFFERFKKKPHQGAKEKQMPKTEAASSASVSAPATSVRSKEDTKDAHRVLLHPLLSEKASEAASRGQYVFVVRSTATRIAVARAIHTIYGVRPVKVNIIRVEGKRVRFGRVTGKQKDWKKAVVVLKKGEQLPVFEGV